MSKYIDADKLKAVIENTYLDGDSPSSHLVINDEDTLIGKFQTIDIIDDQPTADVQEVKHGKWIDEVVEHDKHPSFAGFYCSCCEHYGIIKYNFCPSCGAKMDGEK